MNAIGLGDTTDAQTTVGVVERTNKFLYRVFRVLFESLQVWSCIGWEIDQLEEKRRETVQFGEFHAEQSDDCSWSSGATRVHVPAAEIFKETSNILGFALTISIFSSAAARDLQYIFLLFSIIIRQKTSPLNKVDDLFTQKNGVEEANEINALTTISHKLFNLTEGKEIRQTRG
ncbi:hypothetical protein IGI04_036348 [Brassica rapa subsp. trilocularis]|uniref:Uncharacterized protein n=1 Tax=Brassica rapa subsp. trilocularis TaxID=1813537 RepID=A0ABQ7LEB4_BRACM|nr:hypothetical protein IGI04_036348 [Brassica rapa subsp. trilocularis]